MEKRNQVKKYLQWIKAGLSSEVASQDFHHNRVGLPVFKYLDDEDDE